MTTKIERTFRHEDGAYFLLSLWAFRDEKGRQVTGSVTIAGPGCTRFCRDTEDKFEVAVYAARDGRKFGAIPRRTYYPTLEAAQAAAVKKQAEQRKRYAAKYPGTEHSSPAADKIVAEAKAKAAQATGDTDTTREIEARTGVVPPSKKTEPPPKASTAKPAEAAKLDAVAAKTLRKVATTVPVMQGLVGTDTMGWLHEQAALLTAEVIKPVLGLDAPEVIVSVDADRKGRLGHYKPGRDGLGLSWRVSINLRYLARPRAQVASTLLHEIMHAAQERHGKPGKGNHHNKQFTAWCESLGIPTDAKGHDLGVKEGGPFDLYCKKHNLTGALALIKKSEVPKPPVQKNKKWTCGCGVNVRCAVELNATCDECGTPFVLQEK